MVYTISWGDFIQATRDIISKSPEKTRYVIKLHRPTESIILKVTDNRNSIMYRISKNENLKKVEELNSLFLMWGTNENPNEAFPLKINRSIDKSFSEQKVKKKISKEKE
ncbi:signal recognition particle subunit SRP9, putative [Plasmodium malariae]|uniref:Signal recognition particle subunit SRP9, putative n=1 Tax=Plasmodium malariae TaxID=5858 RepID=A0A1D3JL03_PLAMA|nr:signal recognition particle subunit SRP9, putative [Plasmodium malariae]SBT87190.1 signal recognition particle subunit SRP9, putative [Plasmodium malariae]